MTGFGQTVLHLKSDKQTTFDVQVDFSAMVPGRVTRSLQ